MTLPARPFTRLLVANRGEIAWRVVREAQASGLTPIAIYSDADVNSAHVMIARTRRRIGAAAPAASYLNIPAILDAAKATGAEAVHPGYGFLAENAEFAEAVIAAGLVWIGPPPDAIRAMGDKGAAKRVARQAGVPLIPGYDGDDQSDATLSAEAAKIGWPVMIKAAMGGGGRGMRRVERADDFATALASARREAKSAFADDRVILEKAIDGARHVEVQVFGDAQGNVVHLSERDCSVQRRNQKVLEEAPAPGMTAELRAAMGAAAEKLARAVGYVNAGTVEFLLAQDGQFYFLEMNTRIQVEHPVTEMVTGLNLIRLQFDIAMGKPLSIDLEGVALNGHAIEARLCAEDPDDGFKPQTGTLTMSTEGVPRDVRIDWSGTPDVTGDYDSMIAKVIAHGATRDEARLKLIAALDGLAVLGLRTNRAFLRDVLSDADFAAGGVDTGWLTRRAANAPAFDAELGGIAAALLAKGAGDGWSSTAARKTPVWLKSSGETQRLDGGSVAVTTEPRGGDRADQPVVQVMLSDGRTGLAKIMKDGAHISLGGRDALFEDVTYAAAEAGGAASGEVRSPMAGKIAALKATAGASVAKGDVIAILESMKMEHEIRAKVSGTVASVATSEGAQVAPNAVLVTITPSEG
ncbi:MAG: biotin carboxylase N-terminal domain-containing protein [Micropepsaceae bacterium]